MSLNCKNNIIKFEMRFLTAEIVKKNLYGGGSI